LLFVRPYVTFLLDVFQQVLGVTSCPKTETCHPECINDIAPEKPGININEMVIYSFYYVAQRFSVFPALSRTLTSCSKNFLLSSTEV
jgi:hypothetical protein